MSRRSLVGLVAMSLAGAVAAQSPEGHWAMVDKYCTACHNSTDWAGGMALDTLDHSVAAVPKDAETLEKVVRRLRGRLMPPPG